MSDICFPDYSNSIVNVTAAVLDYVGLTPPHEPLSELSEQLAFGGYRQTVIIVLDGLGADNIRQHLAPDSFIRANMLTELSSVFPPTTVAATTSIETGLYPSEHRRLGWDRYFVAEGLMESGFSDARLTDKYFPIIHIDELLDVHGVTCCMVSPFAEEYPNRCDSLHAIVNRLSKLSHRGKHSVVYAYSPQPDGIMHECGVSSEEVALEFLHIDGELARLQQESAYDTAFVVIADHGQVDSAHCDCLCRHPDLLACLSAPPSIEFSATAFRVKPTCRQLFEELFAQYYTGYRLYTAEEAVDAGLFGQATDRQRLINAIGDYLGVAVSDSCMYFEEADRRFIGVHAGLRHAEMRVPLVFFHGEQPVNRK